MSAMTTTEPDVPVHPSVRADIPATWARLDEQPLVAMLLDTVHDLQCRVVELEKCIGGCQ